MTAFLQEETLMVEARPAFRTYILLLVKVILLLLCTSTH